MFFIMGITNGNKKLSFIQTMVCSRCGQFGRLEAFMTFTCLSLFFIPVFRWNKRYYVRSSCCHTVYELEPSIGKRIQRGEQVILTERDLQHFSGNHTEYGPKKCSNCGFLAEPDYIFCPKCGNWL